MKEWTDTFTVAVINDIERGLADEYVQRIAKACYERAVLIGKVKPREAKAESVVNGESPDEDTALSFRLDSNSGLVQHKVDSFSKNKRVAKIDDGRVFIVDGIPPRATTDPKNEFEYDGETYAKSDFIGRWFVIESSTFTSNKNNDVAVRIDGIGDKKVMVWWPVKPGSAAIDTKDGGGKTYIDKRRVDYLFGKAMQ